MTYLDLVTASLYQGLALVWPWSGEVLTFQLFPWMSDPLIGPTLTAIVGFAAALALMLLLRRELMAIGRNAWAAAKRRQEGSARLLLSILLGALPLLLADYLFPPFGPLPNWLTAGLILLSGIVFFLADWLGVTVRDMDHISPPAYLIIGLLQAAGWTVGIAPQVTTITVARLMGCERDQAVRIAFLLTIPHLLAGLKGLFSVASLPPLTESLLCGCLAFAVTLLMANLLLGWLRRHSLALPAVSQLFLAGIFVLSVAGFGG